MSSRNNMPALATVLALAEAGRNFRDVRDLVDVTFTAAHKYWMVLPLLAAGWAFMVSDEERFAVLEGVAGHLLDALPSDGLERLLAA